MTKAKHSGEQAPICDGLCDHCVPDIYHPCIRPAGHSGYCSCEVS